MRNLFPRKFTDTTAFSLVEIMIAVLFITIGFFGYVALHSRILHSGQRLEEREKIRACTDFYEGVERARLEQGTITSLAGLPYDQDPLLDRIYTISTSQTEGPSNWKQFYTSEFFNEDEANLELHTSSMEKAYDYSWEER